MIVMEKKHYMKPVYLVVKVRTSMICTSTNAYNSENETGLIRTSSTPVSASEAEVKETGNVHWDGW